MVKKIQIHRATIRDIDEIRVLMDASIRDLQKGFLSDAQIKASHEVMGLDTQLIEDGSYCLARSGGLLSGAAGGPFVILCTAAITPKVEMQTY